MSDGVDVHDGATVMIVRDAGAGLEVLMLRRSPSAVFVPGAHCFPGGRVDPADGAEAEHAARVAAVREAFEEAGLVLGAGVVRPGFERESWRADVYAGRRTLAEAAAAAGVHPDPTALHLVARWVTPPGGVRRFDARFFVAAAPEGQEPECDGTELDQCGWWRPVDALAAAERGDITLILPTERSLALLERFDSVAALFAVLDQSDPDDRVVEGPDSWRLRLPDEPDEAAALAGTTSARWSDG